MVDEMVDCETNIISNHQSSLTTMINKKFTNSSNHHKNKMMIKKLSLKIRDGNFAEKMDESNLEKRFFFCD